MGTSRETFRHTLPTPATVLRGERGGHGDDSTASVCGCAFADGPKACPPRVRYAFGERAVAEHLGDPQVFEREGVVLVEHRPCRLVLKVSARALHLLLRPGEQFDGLLAPVAPLLAPGDAPLGFGKPLLGAAVGARMGQQLAVRRDAEHRATSVYPALPAARRQRFSRHLGTSAPRHLGTSAHELHELHELHAYQPSASCAIVSDRERS